MKVADFGISKRYSDSTALYTLLSGDSSFAAPELTGFSDDPTVTALVDIWSLGCLASWLLIYDVLIPTAKMFAFARGKFPVPLNRLTAEGASEQAADFVKMCLCYAPDRRLTAAAALQHVWLRSAFAQDSDSSSTKSSLINETAKDNPHGVEPDSLSNFLSSVPASLSLQLSEPTPAEMSQRTLSELPHSRGPGLMIDTKAAPDLARKSREREMSSTDYVPTPIAPVTPLFPNRPFARGALHVPKYFSKLPGSPNTPSEAMQRFDTRSSEAMQQFDTRTREQPGAETDRKRRLRGARLSIVDPLQDQSRSSNLYVPSPRNLVPNRPQDTQVEPETAIQCARDQSPEEIMAARGAREARKEAQEAHETEKIERSAAWNPAMLPQLEHSFGDEAQLVRLRSLQRETPPRQQQGSELPRVEQAETLVGVWPHSGRQPTEDNKSELQGRSNEFIHASDAEFVREQKARFYADVKRKQRDLFRSSPGRDKFDDLLATIATSSELEEELERREVEQQNAVSPTNEHSNYMLGHEKVHIGDGKYLDRSEIDPIASARVQPTLEDIAVKAEKQRVGDKGTNQDASSGRRQKFLIEQARRVRFQDDPRHVTSASGIIADEQDRVVRGEEAAKEERKRNFLMRRAQDEKGEIRGHSPPREELRSKRRSEAEEEHIRTVVEEKARELQEHWKREALSKQNVSEGRVKEEDVTQGHLMLDDIPPGGLNAEHAEVRNTKQPAAASVGLQHHPPRAPSPLQTVYGGRNFISRPLRPSPTISKPSTFRKMLNKLNGSGTRVSSVKPVSDDATFRHDLQEVESSAEHNGPEFDPAPMPYEGTATRTQALGQARKESIQARRQRREEARSKHHGTISVGPSTPPPSPV